VVIVPSIEVITAFLNKIFTSSDLSAEVTVVSTSFPSNSYCIYFSTSSPCNMVVDDDSAE